MLFGFVAAGEIIEAASRASKRRSGASALIRSISIVVLLFICVLATVYFLGWPVSNVRPFARNSRKLC